MRISDWSSDVCSSDLRHHGQRGARVGHAQAEAALAGFAARVVVLRTRLGDQVVQAQAFDQPQRLAAAAFAHRLHRHDRADAEHQPEQGQPGAQAAAPELLDGLAPRSEEHTSELQSLMRNSYAVFCLTTKHKTNSTNPYI